MSTEQEVARHYRHGALEEAILAALARSGKDIDKLVARDLSDIDEFHLGWLPATVALARDLGFSRDAHVLDAGAGIGGPARYLAEAHGCRVTGIDLSAEFVEVGTALTRRCGLGDRVTFQQASALALPFAEATFDGAILIHVGMNIRDKANLFAEVRRVLKPSARFGVYDIMRTGEGTISYPTPWAATSDTSFVEPVATYLRLLSDSGFTVERVESRRDEVLSLWREMKERRENEGPPGLGLHVLIGAEAPLRLANVTGALEDGVIEPTEILARAS